MPKKIPMRQCLGCRTMYPKKELVRIVRNNEGQVSLDFKGKMPGRGAYICNNSTCLGKAIKSQAIGRALDVTIPEEIFEILRAQMESNE